MNARTTMSAKGQVVIPKDVRDALGFAPGQVLDVVRTQSGVLLKPVQKKSGRSFDEIMDYIRSIAPPHEGPPVSIEDMDRGIDAMFAARGKDDI